MSVELERIVFAAAVALLLAKPALDQTMRYGVSVEPGPIDGVLLKDYKPESSLVVPETRIDKARFPVIDAHAHSFMNGATVDFGSVIPAVLKGVDVPDIAALIAPRPVLFRQALDYGTDDAEVLRFHRVTNSSGGNWIRYEPGSPLTATVLLEWLQGQDKR